MFSVMLFGNLAMCYDIASPFSSMIDLNLLEFTSEIVISIPICSMYGIFTNIFPKSHPNVGKYTSTMDPMGYRKLLYKLTDCSHLRVVSCVRSLVKCRVIRWSLLRMLMAKEHFPYPFVLVSGRQFQVSNVVNLWC